MRLFFSEVDEVVQCLQSKAPEEMLLWALVRLIVIVQRTFYSLFLKYLWSMWSIWRVLKMDGLDEGLSNSNEDSFIISNTNNFVFGLEYLSTSVFHQPQYLTISSSSLDSLLPPMWTTFHNSRSFPNSHRCSVCHFLLRTVYLSYTY